MIEPVEGECARPPIYNNAQEQEMGELPGESQEDQLARSSPPVRSTSEATLTNVASARHQHHVNGDVEQNGEDKIVIVGFEPGTGEDPKEWGNGQKWFVTIGTSFLCLAVALGSAMPTGDLPGAGADLGVSNVVIFLSISLFVVGFGVGPLLFAPLSEVVGRKPVYAISMFFYFIFTLPSALAPNIGTMLVCRLIAGTAASAPMTNVGGTIADIWSVEQRGIPMAIFSMTIFMGPCLGPLFGGWIALKTEQWRWIYWVLFILCGCVFAFTLAMPETLASVLLKRKSAHLRKSTGSAFYQSEGELNETPLAERLKVACLRPLIMMFAEPIVLCMSIYLSFVYALLYLLFFAMPIAFEEIRGWNIGMTGVSFVSVIIGIFLAMLFMPFQERWYKAATVNGPRPEARLFPMMIGAVVLPIGLFIFGFTGAYANVHWIGPCVGGALFGFAMLMLYIAANSYIVDSYANFAASAIAAKTLMRSEVGASVPLWVTQMFHNMGFQYAGLLLALIGCCLAPIPVLFYYKGEAVRKRSERAVK